MFHLLTSTIIVNQSALQKTKFLHTALDLSTLSTSAEAQRAIAELSGKKEILNRIVSVELARPPKQQVEDSEHGRPVNGIPSKNKVIVKNLPLDFIDENVSVPLE